MQTLILPPHDIASGFVWSYKTRQSASCVPAPPSSLTCSSVLQKQPATPIHTLTAWLSIQLVPLNHVWCKIVICWKCYTKPGTSFLWFTMQGEKVIYALFIRVTPKVGHRSRKGFFQRSLWGKSSKLKAFSFPPLLQSLRIRILRAHQGFMVDVPK